LFSSHAWPAEHAFLVQHAATYRTTIRPAAITSNVSRTATAASAATDDVTAASDDVITSADDVTASVDDVIVRPTAAAAADNDGSRE